MPADLLHNRWLLVPLYAWLIAGLLKVVIELIRGRRLILRNLVSSGGMPSAHSALVSALATVIGKDQGLGSPLFALAVILAAVVMYDAAGVRRAVGIQAGILNRMLDEYFAYQNISEQRLREFIGHTPVQVLAGAALGIAAGLVIT